MMKVFTKILLGSMALWMVLSVTGCNTLRGVGKDIKKGGEAIEKAAQ